MDPNHLAVLPKPPPFATASDFEIRILDSGIITTKPQKWYVLEANGTPENPVVFKGNNTVFGDPELDHYSSVLLKGSYIVLEDCLFTNAMLRWDHQSHHVCVRNCKFHDIPTSPLAMRQHYGGGDRSHDIVITGNDFQDIGNWQTEFDEDYHCVSPLTSYNLWVVGNTAARASGDFIQASHHARNNECHHVYVAGNTIRQMKQTAGGVKYADHVIFFANDVEGLKPIGARPSTWGEAFNATYGHSYVWVIGNTIRDCDGGVKVGNSWGPHHRILNNYIYGCRPTHVDNYPISVYDPVSRGYGISVRGGDDILILNNTIVDCWGGIGIGYLERNDVKTVKIHNNLIVNPKESFGISWVNNEETARRGSIRNNAVYAPGREDALFRFFDYNTSKTLNQVEGEFPEIWASNRFGVDPMLKRNGKGPRTHKTSPARDAGDPELVVSVIAEYEQLYGVSLNVDYVLNPRVRGANMDIGAFEGRLRA